MDFIAASFVVDIESCRDVRSKDTQIKSIGMYFAVRVQCSKVDKDTQ